MNGKRLIPLLALGCLLAAAPAWAGNIGININIDAPIPVPIVIPKPPLFLAPSHLGFQVAVGVPEDLFIVGGQYYLHKDNVWRVGSGYNGPWRVVRRNHLPPGLRRHRLREIRSYRDREYAIYKRDKGHYRGRSYRPEGHEHGHDRGSHGYQHRRDDNDRGRDYDRDSDRGGKHHHGRDRD